MKFVLGLLICLGLAIKLASGTFCCNDGKTKLKDEQVKNLKQNNLTKKHKREISLYVITILDISASKWYGRSVCCKTPERLKINPGL